MVFKNTYGNFFDKIMTVFDNMVADKTKIAERNSQKWFNRELMDNLGSSN